MPATLPNSDLRYAIDVRADAKLSEISSEFADAILAVAARLTTKKASDGSRLIDVCDIEAATRMMCAAMEDVLKSGKILPNAGEALRELQSICAVFSNECQQQSTADPIPTAPR